MTFKFPIYQIDNAYAVRPRAIAKSFHYREEYIDFLLREKVLPGFNYKRISLIFIPKQPIKLTVTPIKTTKRKINPVKLPIGRTIYLDWDKLLPQFPPHIYDGYTEFKFKIVSENNQLFLLVN